jgi:hypothetical protein
MDGIRIVAPAPHPGIAYQLAQERRLREEHAQRLAYRRRVMTRAASGACPGCHFGGYDGVRCHACDYQPGKVNGVVTQTGREPRVQARSTVSHSPICPHCKADGLRPWVACRRCGHRNWDPELRAVDFGMAMEYSNPAGSKILSVR